MEVGGPASLATSPSYSRARRVNIKQKNNAETIRPTPLGLASQRTYKTPKKAIKRQITAGKVDPAIIHRLKTCDGFPFEMKCRTTNGKLVKDVRRSCYHCGNNTRWVCYKCSLPFCISSDGESHARGGKEDFRYVVEKENVGPDVKEHVIVYKYSCYHKFHEAAIKLALEGGKDNKGP